MHRYKVFTQCALTRDCEESRSERHAWLAEAQKQVPTLLFFSVCSVQGSGLNP